MQTSKNLSTVEEEHLLDQFYTILADLSEPESIQTFLLSFMTPTERIVFAKRLHIALLLHQGKSYDEISKNLKVSSATISAIAENKNTPGMKQALKLLDSDQKANKTLERIIFWKRRSTP